MEETHIEINDLEGLKNRFRNVDLGKISQGLTNWEKLNCHNCKNLIKIPNIRAVCANIRTEICTSTNLS